MWAFHILWIDYVIKRKSYLFQIAFLSVGGLYFEFYSFFFGNILASCKKSSIEKEDFLHSSQKAPKKYYLLKSSQEKNPTPLH